ncbi:MAG: hypothetical protein ACRDHN_06825, partial [Thermomicrobiales bacterium]
LCVVRWAKELAGAAPLAVFLIAFALSVAAGVLVHVVVERPLLAGLRRLGRSSAWLGGPKAKPSVVGR